MTALETLVSRYHDSGASPGKGVVGYLGADIPVELVAAAGLQPFRLRVERGSSPLAEEILGPRVDPAVRRVLAALLDGALRIDFLLLGHDSDSSVRLFHSLRVLARDERRPPLPEFWFLDLLHLPVETTARYDLDRLRELGAVLEHWSGRPVADERLSAAIREANLTRRLLGRLAGLRRASPPLITGTDALAAIGATTSLPAAAANRLLEGVLAEERGAVSRQGRRVYLTGSGHDSTDLYRAIESDGWVVVGEDHDWGEALADGLVDEDGDPLAAIAARYGSGSAVARRRRTNERAAHIARESEAAGADVVLAWIRTGDDALAWGLPAQRRAVESRGIRFVALEHRGAGAGDVAELAALA